MTDFALKVITISFRNNMNLGAGDPYGEFAQYPSGWIYPYMLNDRGNVNHSPSASVANADSLPESSPQFIENCSTPGAHSMAWCFVKKILFSSATVASWTNFLSLADFKSDSSWTNLKLFSSGNTALIERTTWPINLAFLWRLSIKTYDLQMC